jgi:hypothetical protein
MFGDCGSIEVMTPHVLPSNPKDSRSYPIPTIVSRTIRGISTYASVVTSPATMASPVVTIVSQATRPLGSASRMASRTASEI